MALRFTLHDLLSGTVQTIDEPVGMDKISLHMKRDETYHGFLDALDDSLGSFQFYGRAYQLLRAAYDTSGTDADVRLSIEYQCSDTADYDLLYKGKFAFEQYKEIRGANGCSIECNIQNGNDLLTFRSRMNQKVGLDSLHTFDQPHADLSPYRGLGRDIKLNPKTVRFLNYATIDTTGEGSRTIKAVYVDNTFSPIHSSGQVVPVVPTSPSFIDFSDNYNTDTDNNEFLLQTGSAHCFTPFTNIRSSEFGDFQGLVADQYYPDYTAQDDVNEVFTYTPEIPYDNNNINIDIDISGALFMGDQAYPDADIYHVKVWMMKGLTWNDAKSKSVSGEIYAPGKRACQICNKWLWLTCRDGVMRESVTLQNTMARQPSPPGYGPISVDWCTFRFKFNETIQFFPGEKLFMVFQVDKEPVSYVNLVFFSSTYTYRDTLFLDPAASLPRPFSPTPYLVTERVDAPRADPGDTSTPPPLSFIKLTFDSQYKSTNTPAYLVNEALSRSVELITNDRLRVYSNYFGRAGVHGSQPYAAPVTGYGGLTAITNGLLLRGSSPIQSWYMGTGTFHLNGVSGSAYTLSAGADHHGDGGSILTMAAGGTVTIPDDTASPLPIGSQIMIQQTTSHVISVVAAAGVTLSAPAGSYSTAGEGSQLLLTKVGDRSWMLADHAPMFASFQEMIEALNCIHAVGFGLESDPHRDPASDYLVRVEPIRYFYDHSLVVMQCDNVESIEWDASAGEAISIFKTGYTKWEAEEANGLDEFLSRREYRTTLSALRRTLDRQCKYIASGYAIEVTRRKLGTSTTDWRYDNDTFIICLEDYTPQAGEVAPPDYMTEKNSFTLGPPDSHGWRLPVAANILDATTAYNYRISPARNALRWLPVILSSYRDWAHGQLIFTSGDGNYIAQGMLANNPIESAPLNESATLDLSSLAYSTLYHPIYRNEVVKFKYPMSYAQWQHINTGNNKYGKVRYNVNEGPYEEGYILDLKYDLFGGMAEFTLRPAI